MTRTLCVLLTLIGARLFSQEPVQDFTFTIPGSGQHSIQQYKSKPVLIELIYSTCRPCRAATERLLTSTQNERAHGLELIVLAFDPNAPALVEDLNQLLHPPTSIGYASADQVRHLMRLGPEDTPRVPYIALIDRSGKQILAGALDGTTFTEAELRSRIAIATQPSATITQPNPSRSRPHH